jgi:hypothetical protein
MVAIGRLKERYPRVTRESISNRGLGRAEAFSIG